MADFEIRIKRPRTPFKLTTWEVLEHFAYLEGRTMPNTLEAILEGKIAARWAEFLWETRNPGKATT
jgi:hypothetical protein